MRTNIEIDDELMQKAMAATGTTTKKAAVEASLRKLIDVKAREQVRAVAGRLREESRQAAIREGCLDEWYEELKRSGTREQEPAYADQH
jgi:Arc/MetJ family transcription regulator